MLCQCNTIILLGVYYVEFRVKKFTCHMPGTTRLVAATTAYDFKLMLQASNSYIGSVMAARDALKIQ